MWFFFFKQQTADEMLISAWSADVCSSDLPARDGSCRFGAESDRGSGAEACAIRQARTGRAQSLLSGRRRAQLRRQWPAARKSDLERKSVAVRVDLGGGRIITKKRLICQMIERYQQ